MSPFIDGDTGAGPDFEHETAINRNIATVMKNTKLTWFLRNLIRVIGRFLRKSKALQIIPGI